ncbi:MAG: hemolysin family protein [Alphaproteobacteria bacterium]|nr:hemolysin family protein [Alphaproteobacteria bacterium]MCL2505358.1 hemolysin family protein [Alphaproteobacteria bacterium]
MAELVVVSSRKAKLRKMIEDNNKEAARILEMKENPVKFLSTVQIGSTLNGILIGAYGGTTLSGDLAKYLDAVFWIAPNGEKIAFAFTVVAITYVTLVIGELVPKQIALTYPEAIAVCIAKIMRFLAVVVAPVVWLLSKSTRIVLRLLGLRSNPDNTITEEEVKYIITEGMVSGALKPQEKDMLEGVMRISDRTVRTIMTPRMDIVWLNLDASDAEIEGIIHSKGHSHFPVAKGDLEEVIGVVHAKDLLTERLSKKDSSSGLKEAVSSVMQRPLIVPDTTTIIRLIEQFRSTMQHTAVVVDEYGSIEGLVSTMDVIEAITGELPDAGEAIELRPVKREDGSWLLDGMTPVDEVEMLFKIKNMKGEGDFETLAGFIMDRLKKVPAEGDSFIYSDIKFEVVDMDGRRVDKVMANQMAVDEDVQE